MTATIRIQRRRAKGWKMPENTLCVDRSTKWGNPFEMDKGRTRKQCADLHRALLGGLICVSVRPIGPTATEQKEYLKMAVRDIGELRGKNLACWCPLDQACHADVLLEIANA